MRRESGGNSGLWVNESLRRKVSNGVGDTRLV